MTAENDQKNGVLFYSKNDVLMSCADGHTNASLLVQLTGLAKQLNILIFDDSKNQAANDQDDLDSSKKNELKLLMKPQEIVNFYNSIDKTENSSFNNVENSLLTSLPLPSQTS